MSLLRFSHRSVAQAEYNGWVGIVYEGHSGGMDATDAVPLAAAHLRTLFAQHKL